jgi:hypothetical protein
MTNELQPTIERFLDGDPVAGDKALQELLASGDAGEEALFHQGVEFPKTVQVARRWLRYVASRKSTIVNRLFERLQSSKGAYTAAFLFAGLAKDTAITSRLFGELKTAMASTDDRYSHASDLFSAWGHAGGDGSTLWHFIENDIYAWERLVTFAFRAACAGMARVNSGDNWAIEQLITHELREGEIHAHELLKIRNSPAAKIAHEAVGEAELWAQATGPFAPFLIWRRGEVADVILRDCSKNDHWRVRAFGAQVLASLGFMRILTPLIDWLKCEKLAPVRGSLLHALERTEREAGADALLEHYRSSDGEGRASVARSAWRASDKNAALAALREIAETSAEAVVSLARLGDRHPRLEAMLDASDQYFRLNAALAAAYLGDKARVWHLTAMLNEASAPIERVYLSSALAILGKPNGAADLNGELIAMSGASNYDDRLDVFFMHRYLQIAVLDGLQAGGQGAAELWRSWQQELEPLEPVPMPVKAKEAPKYASVHKRPAVTNISQPARHAIPGKAKKTRRSGPLRKVRIFLASSSELREDRDEFDLYFRQQNDSLLKENIYLQIVRWENFLDSMSETRLQDEYNKAICECDVVVSLFFTKTGKFTDEEFDVAHMQFQSTGRPLIYTYFKNADIKTGSAREEDLISLWAFQKKLKNLGHYQTNYDNTEHLKRQFRDQIDRILEKLNLAAGN